MLSNSSSPRIIAVFGIMLLLAASADSQMNRDSPFLGSKVPRMTDEGVYTKTAQVPSSFSISTPSDNHASPDLILSEDAANTSCSQTSFLVTLNPALSGTAPAGYQLVKVRIQDNSLGTIRTVAELVLLVPSQGGSGRETIGFFRENPSQKERPASQITVIVDPENEIQESNEGNNILTLTGNCRQ